MIELVGFDGDDTLWRSQEYFEIASSAFEAIVGEYVDLADLRLHERLLAIEQANMARFGYGAKGMTLSMIEAAVQVTGERISARDIHRIVALGKDVLDHPVELLPGIRQAVEAVAQSHRIVLITKGDLFHQEHKVAHSKLADLFHRIEIVSEKDDRAYARVLGEFNTEPGRFAMVGNSLRSDIAPVVSLGGWGVYMPYHVTWAHETGASIDDADRMVEVADATGIPGAVRTLEERARMQAG